MAVTSTPDIADCCQALDPCKALCMLEHAELNLAMGKEITSYKIGEETFTYKKPSLTDLRTLINIYRERCRESQCLPARRRGGGNFMYAKRRCRGYCGSRSSCGGC